MTGAPAAVVLFSVRRQRVSLAGHVVRGDGTRAAGGEVTLSTAAMPGPPGGRGAGGSSATAPADAARRVTPVRPDGRYCFMNLPAGDYTVAGRDERGLPTDARTVAVPPPDPGRRPPLLAFDLGVAGAAPRDSGEP